VKTEEMGFRRKVWAWFLKAMSNLLKLLCGIVITTLIAIRVMVTTPLEAVILFPIALIRDKWEWWLTPRIEVLEKKIESLFWPHEEGRDE